MISLLCIAVVALLVAVDSWAARRNRVRAEDAAKTAAEAADIAVRAARSAGLIANKTYFDQQGSRR